MSSIAFKLSQSESFTPAPYLDYLDFFLEGAIIQKNLINFIELNKKNEFKNYKIFLLDVKTDHYQFIKLINLLNDKLNLSITNNFYDRTTLEFSFIIPKIYEINNLSDLFFIFKNTINVKLIISGLTDVFLHKNDMICHNKDMIVEIQLNEFFNIYNELDFKYDY